MKKVTVVVAAAVVALGAASAMAKVNDSNIINSKHNLNNQRQDGYPSGATNTQICVYCHTPHNARMNVPIWNREATTNNFTLYSSVTMLNSKHATGFTNDSISLFCMSCHDGSILGGTMIHSVNNGAFARFYTGQGALSAGVNIISTANFGKNLSNTHPVNFVASKSLNDSSTNPQKRNDGQPDLNFTDADWMGPVNPALGLGGSVKFPLFVSNGQNGYLECSSCHSVHDDYNRPFLRDTMDNSRLCLGCHNK